ncbi:uncharacterized protein PHALS_05441 [Plasmopara halstedii]|uniref:Uncharacterized protein n=1 Tax=Plasmopara halstedii TaxID=4781 RepID=A0A0P1ABJ3_PLAHL|nr:uncharacterized protein PHALS_05441 [Plasmopara halstedii]CEG37663.1 hypothetical protein PHALS_05441 [Plasmopara halstedii]|eukprot:XP_024574032.1 hypothetical protein PHALS_05441 [Plasmopara halstedii]
MTRLAAFFSEWKRNLVEAQEVADSSIETEFASLYRLTHEAIRLCVLLTNMFFEDQDARLILQVNQGRIVQAKNTSRRDGMIAGE